MNKPWSLTKQPDLSEPGFLCLQNEGSGNSICLIELLGGLNNLTHAKRLHLFTVHSKRPANTGFSCCCLWSGRGGVEDREKIRNPSQRGGAKQVAEQEEQLRQVGTAEREPECCLSRFGACEPCWVEAETQY